MFEKAFDRAYSKAFVALSDAPLDHYIGLRSIAKEIGTDFRGPEFKRRIQQMINMGGKSPFIFAPAREARENLQVHIPGLLHEQAVGLAARSRRLIVEVS